MPLPTPPVRQFFSFLITSEFSIVNILMHVESIILTDTFFVELGRDNNAHKNNPPDEQPFFLQVVRRVLYMYF